MSLDVIIEHEKLFVGKIKSLTQDTDVKNLFDRYAPESSKERNVQLLGASSEVKKAHLEAAVAVLLGLAEEYPDPAQTLAASKANTKATLAEEISVFIRKARISNCRKCDSTYSPHMAVNIESPLSCHFCKTPCHKGCYSDHKDDPEAGIVFLCHSCLGSPVPPPITRTQELSESKPAQEQVENSTPAPTKEGESKKEDKNFYDRTKEICSRLLAGDCPHGISGKECPNYHPPWCSRYQRNGGNGNKFGCRKPADKCRYYHPALCQNALVTGTCLNTGCKQVHIRGTNFSANRIGKRNQKGESSSSGKSAAWDKPKKDKPDQSVSSRKRTTSESSVRSNKSNGDPRSVRFPKTIDRQDDEDFQKHLSQMKSDLKKDMESSIQSALSQFANLLNLPQQQCCTQKMPRPTVVPSRPCHQQCQIQC